MENDPEYLKAKRRVHELKGFYTHLLVFVLTMVFLLCINIATKSEWWVQWPFLGWGLGVLAHAFYVFGLIGWLGPDWEERKIQALMAKKQ
jgi:hypothetical protein